MLHINQAIEMENTNDICIYHSGCTLSPLNDLPQFSIWKQNWKDLISKYRKIPLSKLFNFIDFDYIYVMDIQNYKDVIALAPNLEAKSKIHLIGPSALQFI